MNKTIILFAAAALLLGWSCSRIEESAIQEKPSAGVEMTFTASLGDVFESKTALQPEENGTRAIWWTPGDAINVFYGSETAGKFSTEITEPVRTAKFKGNIGVATGSADENYHAASFWGVYPYDEDNSCDGEGVTMTISGQQKGLAGGFADKFNPTIANSRGLDLSFYNVGSWFVFTVSQTGITSLTLEGNNNEDLVGKVRVTVDSNGKPVTEIKEGIKSITITPNGGGSFAVGEEYRIVLVPQTLSGGITLTMKKGAQTGTTQITSSLTFKRSSYLRKKNADSSATWEDSPDYVEMGPGIFWGTKNVGANSPEEYGDYFAWGETSPKTTFNWNNYKWGTKTSLTKYVTDSSLGTVDNLSTLQPEDDAATVNLGEHWRTPTRLEWKWLENNCEWTRTDDGFIVTSTVSGYEGNSIFLPAGGCIYTSSQDVGTQGYYWSSTLDADSDGAYSYYFNRNPSNSYHNESDDWRYPGLTVRPVYDTSVTNGHEFVEMGDGLKWATMNVGASKPEDGGDFFAWAETEPKTDYTWSTYKYYLSTASPSADFRAITKYQTADGRHDAIWYDSNFNFIGDGKTSFADYDYEDDAARQNWGGTWRTPTADEWENLLDTNKYTWTFTIDYEGTGVRGLVVTSLVPGYEGNSIFLPATGFSDMADMPSVYIWSSTIKSTGAAYYLNSYYNDLYFECESVYLGCSVRPVSD